MVKVAEVDVLRLGSDAETVVSQFNLADFIGVFLAKGTCSPVAGVEVCAFGRPAVYVPGQVHAELQFLFGRLDVAHIDDPLVAHPLTVCLAKLVAAERGRDGAEPQIASRRPPIG